MDLKMSGTEGNMKNNKKFRDRGDMSKTKKRRMFLEICTSERDDTSKKAKKSMSLQQCTSERRGKCIVFPDDLIAEILIRLPTKALYRCKCVCKSWTSLISEQNFLNNFITRSKSRPPLLTGVYYIEENAVCDEKMHTDFLDLGTLKTTTTLVDSLPVDICFSFLKCCKLAVAAHNGFVLFAERSKLATFETTHFYRFDYIVCNPLTKQCLHLPKPRCIHHLITTFLFCYNKKGFGDQLVEFKVASFLSWPRMESKVEVYSSETGKWKLSSLYHDEDKMWDIIFMFNGCVCFWGQKHFFLYDLMEETTRKVELPPNASNTGHFQESDGLLYYAHTCYSSFWVWVLVDGVGWDLVHKVEYASLAREFPYIFGSFRYSFRFGPFGFHPLNHELVLVQSAGKRILYHTGTREAKFIDGFCPKRYPRVIPYSLPAWLPFLPNTLRHAKPAAGARKRMDKSSKARVALKPQSC